MIIEQLYTNCLAEAAYYIESEGECAIIDPMREVGPYLEKALKANVKIKYVFETHFHADFVSGHVDLAAETGAKIVYGPKATPSFKAYIAKDGEEFTVGKLTIRVLHTPGHTVESSCYLLLDETGKEHCLFTGDTLFVGDVGRPDLLDASVTLTKEEMAGMMFDSIHQKISKLPDSLIVYPAHGPGSACGKNIGKETWSTLEIQKKTNYAFQIKSKDEFITALTSDLVAPPAYFFADAKINKEGYKAHEQLLTLGMKGLTADQFQTEQKNGAIVLDTRNATLFEKGFILGSINVGLDGSFAVWAATLLPLEKPLILVAEIGKEEESVTRLLRVGFSSIIGHLSGGIKSWIDSGKKTDTIDSITPEDFATNHFGKSQEVILDVRKVNEVSQGKVKGAFNIPLDELNVKLETIDKTKPYLIHCAGGYRSMIATSMMKARGFTNLKNIYGGYSKIKEFGTIVD